MLKRKKVEADHYDALQNKKAITNVCLPGMWMKTPMVVNEWDWPKILSGRGCAKQINHSGACKPHAVMGAYGSSLRAGFYRSTFYKAHRNMPAGKYLTNMKSWPWTMFAAKK